MTDYKEIKKGIKQVESDQIHYKINTFLSVLFGAFIGFIFHSLLIGFIAFIVPGVLSARKYFETDKPS